MHKYYRFLWLLLGLSLGLMSTTQAQVFSVTTTSDTGTGSLRQAITDVNASPLLGSYTITVTVSGTISLGTALTNIERNTTFLGPGAANLTVRRSSGTFRIFNIPNNNTVSFDGFTIADGSVTGSGGASATRAN